MRKTLYFISALLLITVLTLYIAGCETSSVTDPIVNNNNNNNGNFTNENTLINWDGGSGAPMNNEMNRICSSQDSCTGMNWNNWQEMNSCGTIENSGCYRLSCDLYVNSGDCGIKVKDCEFVCIDLNGHSIHGNGECSGIKIDNCEKVIIRNGCIRECHTGIYCNNSQHVVIKEMKCYGSDTYGGNETGCRMVNCDESRIAWCCFTNYNYGICASEENSTLILMHNNTISCGNNGRYGIWCGQGSGQSDDCNDNRIYNCNIRRYQRCIYYESRCHHNKAKNCSLRYFSQAWQDDNTSGTNTFYNMDTQQIMP
jgi:hypothetical protein